MRVSSEGEPLGASPGLRGAAFFGGLSGFDSLGTLGFLSFFSFSFELGFEFPFELSALTLAPSSSPLEIVSALLYATLFLLEEALAVLAGLVKTSSTSSGDSIEASSSSSSSASSAKSLDSSSAPGGSMRVMKVYKKVSSSERVREGGEEGGRRKEEEGGRTSRFLDATRSYLVFFGAEALSGELSCYITVPSHQLPPFLRALHENNRHSPAPSQQPP